MRVKSNLLTSAMLGLVLALGPALAGAADMSGAQEPAAPAPAPAPNAPPRMASQSIDSQSIDQPARNPAAQHGVAQGRWGFDDSGVDPKANPGDSFFDFANGTWHARAVIPADKSRFGAFDALTDKTQEQVRAIIEE